MKGGVCFRIKHRIVLFDSKRNNKCGEQLKFVLKKKKNCAIVTILYANTLNGTQRFCSFWKAIEIVEQTAIAAVETHS